MSTADDATVCNAELIKELRIAAHALELDNPRYPSAYIVSLLDQAADALKTAWIEHQTMLALKQLLVTEPNEEQKKQMLRSFDHEAKIS